MPGRRRYLVALVVSGWHAIEIDGLRRALGSRDRLRIAPHITVVPPINVAENDIAEVVDHVAKRARATTPIHVELGPAATFDDRDDVVFLRVGGEDFAIDSLRTALSIGALQPPASRDDRPFIAHVTLASGLDASRSHASVEALSGFHLQHRFDSLSLLEQDVTNASRPWHVVGEFRFEQSVIRGRGGREIEFTFASQLDPVARSFFEHEWVRYVEATYGAPVTESEPFALVARYDGAVVGVATGTANSGIFDLERLIVGADRRGEGIGTQLLRRLERIVEESHGTRIRLKTNEVGRARSLYEQLGYVAVGTLANWRDGRTFVVMERPIRV